MKTLRGYKFVLANPIVILFLNRKNKINIFYLFTIFIYDFLEKIRAYMLYKI